MDELVHLDLTGGAGTIATITLDSPHNRNALSSRLVTELSRVLNAAIAATPRAIVITHTGPAFCAGADLKERREQPSDGADPRSTSPFVSVLSTIMNVSCPTIAAVHGAVRAGGIGLMAACDLVVVADDVTFALTEVRIGVAPAIISVPILRRVPPTKIAAAMLTGERFDAHAAREMGLVTHVSPAAGVSSTVDGLCDGLLAGAPNAVAVTKRLLHEVPTMPTGEAFEAMGRLSADLFAGPEAAEGIAAFTEKRAPVWD